MEELWEVVIWFLLLSGFVVFVVVFLFMILFYESVYGFVFMRFGGWFCCVGFMFFYLIFVFFVDVMDGWWLFDCR